MKIAALTDLQIDGEGNFTKRPNGEPIKLRGVAVVIQDIRHRLVESGIPSHLIGIGPAERNDVAANICFVAEQDRRIEPGSAEETKIDG